MLKQSNFERNAKRILGFEHLSLQIRDIEKNYLLMLFRKVARKTRHWKHFLMASHRWGKLKMSKVKWKVRIIYRHTHTYVFIFYNRMTSYYFLLVLLDTKEDNEPVLPAAQPLQTLFNKRAAFSSGEDVSGRFEKFCFWENFFKIFPVESYHIPACLRDVRLLFL